MTNDGRNDRLHYDRSMKANLQFQIARGWPHLPQPLLTRYTVSFLRLTDVFPLPGP